jgi:hypothetical protein
VIGDYGELEEGTKQIHQVLEAIAQDKMIIEITGQFPFDVRMAHRFWAVRDFGPEVNMGGGGQIEEAHYIESIRRGLGYVKGPSKSSPLLWMRSLAKNGGMAAEDWWIKEEYPIDPTVTASMYSK